MTFNEDSFPARKDIVGPKTQTPEVFELVDSDSEDSDKELFGIPLPLPVNMEDDDSTEPAEPVGGDQAQPCPDPVPPPNPPYSCPR